MSIVITNITGNFKEDADIVGKMVPCWCDLRIPISL